MSLCVPQIGVELEHQQISSNVEGPMRRLVGVIMCFALEKRCSQISLTGATINVLMY